MKNANTFDEIYGIFVRTAYRALLKRAPERGVLYSDLQSPISKEEEIILESFLSQILASHEFTQRQTNLSVQFPPETWVMAELQDQLFMWLDLGDRGVSRPALEGTYEPLETRFLESVLKPGMNFADVGANIGWFALRAARAVGPAGSVTAFEPRKETSRRLQMSIEANGFADWASVHAVALGNEEGEMFIGYGSDGVNSGGTWSLPSADLVDQFRNDGQIVQPVTVKRFDDVPRIGKLDFLKIDIEGAEILALRGAEKTLREDKPIILAEINPGALATVSQATPNDFLNFMKSFGYKAFHLTGDGIGTEVGNGIDIPTEIDMINIVFQPFDL